MSTLISKKQKAAVLIDEQDVVLVGAYNWTCDKSHSYFYRIEIDSKDVQHKIYLHHEIAELKEGRRILQGECVDHVNGDKSDNRRDNLRIVTFAQNAINKDPLSLKSKSGFTGVTFNKKGKFVVRVGRKTVGRFDTIQQALKARIDYIGKVYDIDVSSRVKKAAASVGIIL